MSLRMLSGQAKADYYTMAGEVEPIGSKQDQILKSSDSGPQLVPFYQSLFSGEPHNIDTRNMAVDGSVTPVRFKLSIPIDRTYLMTRMIMIIRDDGSMDTGGWGNNGGIPLINGITFGAVINGEELNFTPISWTTHADLAGVAYDLTYHDWGQGTTFVTMRLTIAKSGTLLRFIGSEGDYLWMDVNDNLTHLIEQKVMIQGKVECIS